MHRRARTGSLTRFVLAFVAAIVMFGAAPVAAGVDEPVDRPPVTVSDFIPDDTNLSDCVGLVEKPGCGSESRGGWRQAAIFGALALGLGLIIWRIVAGLRANERAQSTDGPDHRATPSDRGNDR